MSDLPGPSTSAAATAAEESPKTEEECKKMLCQGEIMLMRYRYAEAVDVLEECVRNLDRINGEGHDSNGEAYLYYGRALLGMEQSDESLFQKGMDGAADAEEDSEEEEDEEEQGEGDGEEEEKDGEGEGEEEKAEEGEKKAEEREEKAEDGEKKAGDGEKKAEDGEKKAEDEEKAEEIGEEAAAAENAEIDGDATDSPAPPEEPEAPAEGTEQDEQITNMQVAWEVTEVARKIFAARGSDDAENVKKLARAYATLAEIAMVSGQYADSATDFGRAFDLMVKTDDTLREQAEILYLRSNALVSSNKFDEAKEALKLALDKLSDQQEALKGRTDETAAKEIEEVESLKKQLSTKFDEIEIAREDIARFREQKEKVGVAGSSKSPMKPTPGPSSSGAGPSSAGPVHDITHMIRRRKKPDAEGDGPSTTTAEVPEAKKAKVDALPAENGGSKPEMNGTNGEAKAAVEAQ